MYIVKRVFRDIDFTVSASVPKDRCLLFYLEKGKGKITHNNNSHRARSGLILLAKAGDNISCNFPKDDTVFYAVEFNTDEVSECSPFLSFGIGSATNEVHSLFHRLHREFCLRNKTSEIKCRVILTQLLWELVSPTQKSEADVVLDELCLDIHNNFISGEIDVRKYAERLGISRDRLSVMFRERFHYPPYKYQLMLKMEEATFLLKHTDLSVAEISERLNFSSPLYFSAAFKRQLKKSPTEIRKWDVKKVQTAKRQ